MITELKLDMESAFNAINCRLRLNILYRVELNGTGQIMIKKMFFFSTDVVPQLQARAICKLSLKVLKRDAFAKKWNTQGESKRA